LKLALNFRFIEEGVELEKAQEELDERRKVA
jgi:hypothetical protein